MFYINTNMKFEVTKWDIQTLHDYHEKKFLNLSPPYQRNFIWSITDQRYLIDSIKRNNPIPNFFILKTGKNEYEMVDGQQRSRTILSFLAGQFKDFKNVLYNKKDYPGYLSYEFPVTIISDTEGESIKDFYAMVNKTGVHLNKPEVRKADYYDTILLKLINELSSSKQLVNLKIFTDSSLKRMNDTDFVSELIILIIKGHIDKKNHIDDYFKKDITQSEYSKYKATFITIIEKITNLNKIFEISKTRYKQRNDFYTLFDFIKNHDDLKQESLNYFYKLLVAISSDIKPSQSDCLPLMEYARNCVTQSNSKTARENRLTFFEEFLLNSTSKLNKTQNDIIEFYKLTSKDTAKVENYLNIDIQKLNTIKNIQFKI